MPTLTLTLSLPLSPNPHLLHTPYRPEPYPGMLDALESRQRPPTGPELAEALRMCRIGA